MKWLNRQHNVRLYGWGIAALGILVIEGVARFVRDIVSLIPH